MAEDSHPVVNNQYLEIELLDDRKIFLDGDITIDSIGKLLKQMMLLQTRGKTKKQPIKLYINSSGGSIYDMLALYDAIRTSPCEVHTIVTGTAMSAAAFILIAGHKRYAHENSKIMLHEISDSLVNSTKVSDLEIQQEENKKLMLRLNEILIKHTKLSRIQSKDLYISSTTALEWGLIDNVIRNK